MFYVTCVFYSIDTTRNYKKREIANQLQPISDFLERSLADSNRCARFCRPVTKPLIQATFRV